MNTISIHREVITININEGLPTKDGWYNVICDSPKRNWGIPYSTQTGWGYNGDFNHLVTHWTILVDIDICLKRTF
jgi:hypothetical protein